MKGAVDLAIVNGTAVLPRGARRAHVLVRDGKITGVTTREDFDAKKVIDVKGCHVFPGFIDSHVHLNEPGRERWEGLVTGTRALAAGGVTTFFDMPLNSTPPVVSVEEVERKRECARKKSRIDFGLWGGLVPGNVAELKGMVRAGVVGFKAFLCHSGIEDFPAADARTLEAGAREVARLGKILAVHAESERWIQKAREGHVSWKDYAASRPVEAEMESVREALEIARKYRCCLHVVHVSSARVMALIKRARQAGVDVTCETCPHYLLLDERAMGRLGGMAKCAPPLRPAREVENVWKALKRGEAQYVASDHSPSPMSMKRGADYFRIWGGINGCQHAFPLFLGEAKQRGFSLTALAGLSSGVVAVRFGLAGKGAIQVGMDADFAVVRFKRGGEIATEELFYRHAFSPYVGLRARAQVLYTLVRGQMVYEHGRVNDRMRGREVRFERNEGQGKRGG